MRRRDLPGSSPAVDWSDLLDDDLEDGGEIFGAVDVLTLEDLFEDDEFGGLIGTIGSWLGKAVGGVAKGAGTVVSEGGDVFETIGQKVAEGWKGRRASKETREEISEQGKVRRDEDEQLEDLMTVQRRAYRAELSTIKKRHKLAEDRVKANPQLSDAQRKSERDRIDGQYKEDVAALKTKWKALKGNIKSAQKLSKDEYRLTRSTLLSDDESAQAQEALSANEPLLSRLEGTSSMDVAMPGVQGYSVAYPQTPYAPQPAYAPQATPGMVTMSTADLVELLKSARPGEGVVATPLPPTVAPVSPGSILPPVSTYRQTESMGALDFEQVSELYRAADTVVQAILEQGFKAEVLVSGDLPKVVFDAGGDSRNIQRALWYAEMAARSSGASIVRRVKARGTAILLELSLYGAKPVELAQVFGALYASDFPFSRDDLFDDE